MLFGVLLVGESGKRVRNSGGQSSGASVQRSRLTADKRSILGSMKPSQARPKTIEFHI